MSVGTATKNLQAANAGAVATTPASFVLPADVGPNDMAVLWVISAANTLIPQPPKLNGVAYADAGWTQIYAQSFNSTGGVALFKRKLVADDAGTTVTVSFGGGTGAAKWSAILHIESGCSDIDVSPIYTAGNGAGINLTGTTLALTETDQRVATFWGSARPSGAPVWTVAVGSPYGAATTTATTSGGSDSSAGTASYVEPSNTGKGISVTSSQSNSRTGVVVTFKAADLRPTVDAGPDQSAAAGATIQLAATVTDPDGGASGGVWAWTQTAGPATPLSNAAIANPTFVAPNVAGGTALTYQAVYTDPGGRASNPDSVSISTASPLVSAINWRTDGQWFTKPLKVRKNGAWQ